MKRSIDFLGVKWYWIGISLALMAASIVAMATLGINYGIDFAGGTEIIVKCREARGVEPVRATLASVGFGDAVIQSYGGPNDAQFLIRVTGEKGQVVEGEGSQTVAAQILEALRKSDPPAGGEGKTFDVNAASPEEWAAFVEARLPGKGTEVAGLIRDWMKDHGGIFKSVEEPGKIAGVPPEVASALTETATAGNYVQLKADVVGPTVGKELRWRAFWAVMLSLLGILGYIWFRFELNFGVGAVLCLFHDVVISLGALVVARVPLDVTCIAALLTIVGYSVNDTVVVFDRVRENLRSRSGEPYEGVFNRSINQTLSRTLLTSGLTLITVLCLLFFGGPVIFGFALALTVGIVTGTYSSIYIASPIAIYWHQFAERFKKGKKPAPKGRGARAEKAAV